MRRQSFVFTSKEPNPDTGVNPSWIVTSQFIAKGNSDDSPYLVPNEYICGRIADHLNLSIPPFGFMKQSGRHKGHKVLFASLRFTKKDSEPLDFDPDLCCEDLPDQCSGVLLFDLLIANFDRHRYNIQCDNPKKPRRVHIFDHDHALFGTFKGDGIRHLKQIEERLGISGGSVSGGNCHCLLKRLKTNAHFDKWHKRIESIPDGFIEEICGEVRGLGASKKEVEAAAKFLNERKNKLRRLVYDNRAELEGIDRNIWGMFP